MTENTTKRKQQEALLERTSIKFNALFDSISTGFEIYDKDGIIIDCNNYELSIFGIENKEEFLNQKISLFDNPNLQVESTKQLMNGQEARFEFWYDFDLIKKNNYYRTSRSGKIYLQVKGLPMFTKANELIGYIFEVNEATLTKIQEIELKETHDYLSLALSGGKVSVWKYDIKNECFSTVFGNTISDGKLTYEHSMEILHPDDRDDLRKLFDDLSSGKVDQGMMILRYYDESYKDYRYYESHMMNKYENGKVTIITGTQKEVTNQFLHQKKLDEYNKQTILINEISGIVQWDYSMDTHILYSESSNALMPNTKLNLDTDLDVYLQFTHPEDRHKVLTFINQANSKVYETLHMEVRLKSPNQKDYRHHTYDGVAIRNQKGEITKYTGIHRDVTRWVEMNKEIVEKNITNNTILHNINSGLLYFDTEGTLKWSNFDSVNGTLRKINIGRKPGDRICQVLGNQISINKEEFLKARSIVSNEKKIGDITVNITFIPVLEGDDKMIGILFKIDDISEIKRINDELQVAKETAIASNKILNELLDNIPCVMYIKNCSDNCRFVVANKKFCESLNLPADKIIGHTYSEIYPMCDSEKYNHYDTLSAQANKTYIYEEYLSFSGPKKYWNIIKAPMKMENGDIYTIGIATDLSDIKKANAERRAAKKADKLKSAFLANMSHEIRTPLNSIVGFSQLLKSAEDESERNEFIKIINSNSNILLRLINDILDLSKIESGYMDLKREEFDLSTFFDEIFQSFIINNKNSNVKLINKNIYDKCIVTLDKRRVTEIEMNFISNAIKHTSSGYILSGYEYINNGIKLFVEDTGEGIPSDKQHLLFQRFAKLSKFTQGTGLGLAICKAIVDSVGGKIGFKSCEGKGSTFWAWIPCQVKEISYATNDAKAAIPRK